MTSVKGKSISEMSSDEIKALNVADRRALMVEEALVILADYEAGVKNGSRLHRAYEIEAAADALQITDEMDDDQAASMEDDQQNFYEGYDLRSGDALHGVSELYGFGFRFDYADAWREGFDGMDLDIEPYRGLRDHFGVKLEEVSLPWCDAVLYEASDAAMVAAYVSGVLRRRFAAGFYGAPHQSAVRETMEREEAAEMVSDFTGFMAFYRLLSGCGSDHLEKMMNASGVSDDEVRSVWREVSDYRDIYQRFAYRVGLLIWEFVEELPAGVETALWRLRYGVPNKEKASAAWALVAALRRREGITEPSKTS